MPAVGSLRFLWELEGERSREQCEKHAVADWNSHGGTLGPAVVTGVNEIPRLEQSNI